MVIHHWIIICLPICLSRRDLLVFRVPCLASERLQMSGKPMNCFLYTANTWLQIDCVYDFVTPFQNLFHSEKNSLASTFTPHIPGEKHGFFSFCEWFSTILATLWYFTNVSHSWIPSLTPPMTFASLKSWIFWPVQLHYPLGMSTSRPQCFFGISQCYLFDFFNLVI